MTDKNYLPCYLAPSAKRGAFWPSPQASYGHSFFSFANGLLIIYLTTLTIYLRRGCQNPETTLFPSASRRRNSNDEPFFGSNSSQTLQLCTPWRALPTKNILIKVAARWKNVAISLPWDTLVYVENNRCFFILEHLSLRRPTIYYAIVT